MKRIKEIGLYASNLEKFSKFWTMYGKIVFFMFCLLLNLLIFALPVYPEVIYAYAASLGICLLLILLIESRQILVSCSWALLNNILILVLTKYMVTKGPFDTDVYFLSMSIMAVLTVATCMYAKSLSRIIFKLDYNKEDELVKYMFLILFFICFILFFAVGKSHEEENYDRMLERAPAEKVISLSKEVINNKSVYLLRFEDKIEIVDPQEYPEITNLQPGNKIILIKSKDEIERLKIVQ